MTIEEMNQQDVPCIHETFHKQALLTPNNTCLIDATNKKIYTYKETQRRVLLLATEIKKTVFVENKKDQVVAIYLEPSPEYIIALLAILSSGCAYVPLELAYPTTMLQRVLSDCNPIAIITNVEHKGNLPTNTTSTTTIVHHHHHTDSFGYEVNEDDEIVTKSIIHPADPKLMVMDDNKHDNIMSDELLLESLWKDYNAWSCKPTLDDLAFIVYSSGTTGQPKGIANSHRAPALSYKWRFNDVRDCPSQSIVACNVFFVWECVRPLLRGAAAVPIPPSIIFDGELLSQYIQTFNITEILFTPSLLENLLNTIDKSMLQNRLSTVNTIYLNGEVVSMELRRRCLSLFPLIKQENDKTCCKFYNLYSISECHEVSAIDLDAIDMTNDKSMKFCPVGLPSTQIYILEEGIDTTVLRQEMYEPMPLGEVGELYVAGPMLARGYLNLPDVTSQRFVMVNGKRMYRTGDRARLLPSTGQLEILGRCDFMVKIRGYSIVLGAVEAALLDAVHLDSCVVVADEDEQPQQLSGNSDNTEGNKHLVAYVVRSTAPQNNNDIDDNSDDCSSNKLSDWTIDPRTGACTEIRRALIESLPHYMIPSVFIELESLPVKEVGAKLDRKALQSQSKDRRAMLRSLQLSSATHTTHLQTTATHDDTITNETTTVTATDDDVLKTVARRWKNMLKYLTVRNDAPLEDIQDTVTTVFEIAMDRPIGSLKLNSDFLEEGGHSLSAARLIALLNKVFGPNNKLTVVQLFRNSASVQFISESIFSSSQPTDANTTATNNNSRDISSDVSSSKEWSIVGGNCDESSSTTIDSSNSTSALILKQVRDDAILPVDLLESSSTHDKAIENATTLEKANNIFVTGVTGYFGSHILKEILKKNTSATVHCLVRSASLSNADLLFQQLKNQFGVHIHHNYNSRVVIVKGDLSLPQLGVNNDEWSDLASKIEFIVHCGAAVSLTASYAKLKPVNVGGTLSIIKLAHACRSINKLNTSLLYVSSNGIFPKDDEVFFENDDIACLPDRLGSADGYGLSKWTADSIVSAAHKYLSLPTITIRYGNLGWHSNTGVGNPLDYQGMMLSGCRRLGVFPKATKGWILEVTPVDFASYALATLASDSKLLQDGSIFHCVQDDWTKSDHVYRWMCDTDGCSYRTVPFNEWKKIIEEQVADSNCDASVLSDMIGLMALVSGFDDNASYLSTQSLLDCTKLDSALDQNSSGTNNLSRKGLVNEAYYTKFFGATFDKVFDRKLTVTLPSINDQSPKSTEAIKADPSVPASESSSPTGPLAGKVAVVTGASSGIGRAIVVSLVQAGCHVAMGARRIGELEKTRSIVAESCKGCVSKTICVSTDVTKREQVESLVETAEITLGPVDILVNVAGCMYFTLMKNVMWDQWEQQVDVNAKGTMYGIGTVLPKMLQRGKGHIVNITSDAGRKAFAGLGIYSGSKFFVEAVSQALRLETASTGLRVTCIQPGNVATPLLSKSTDPEGLEEYGTPTGAKVLEPADIGRAVVYALTQPEWCAVNEILVEPREEPA